MDFIGQGKTSLFLMFDPVWKEKSYFYVSAAKPFEKLPSWTQTASGCFVFLIFCLGLSATNERKRETEQLLMLTLT